MTHRPPFSWHELRRMLRELRALVQTSEGRRLIAEQLEGAVRRSRMGNLMLDKVLLMRDYVRDPAEPLKTKVLIGAALLYLVIPSDLIPDWFAVVGFADDFAAIAFVWNQTRDILTHYDARRTQRVRAEAEA